MNLLNKLTIKSLKLNKKRTMVSIIGIMLSVALLSAVDIMYASGIKTLIDFEIRQDGDYHIVYHNVPVSDLDTFRNNRSIAEMSLAHDLGYAVLDSKNEYKPYAFVREFTKDALAGLSINIEEGRLPENENEILIPSHLKAGGRNDLGVGDSITLAVGQRVDPAGNVLTQDVPYPSENTSESEPETIIHTTEKTYEVVGVMRIPERNFEDYDAPGYTFVTYVDESQLKDKVDVFVRYTKDAAKKWERTTANILGLDPELYEAYINGEPMDEDLENRIESEVNHAKYWVEANGYLIKLETNPFKINTVVELRVALIIVLCIIVFTSIFCIKNSFDISITERIKQYGMLRSIGATKKQIRKNVFYEATILGLIGVPAGLLLGSIASVLLVVISNCFIKGDNSDDMRLVLSISPLALLAAVILGIITIYFSALRSVRRASRVSPIDSIRNSANIKISVKKVRSPKIIKKLFGVGGEISYKNLKRNKKKYRATVISIVVSVFVFIALSSFLNVSFRVIETQVDDYDYDLYLSGASYDNEGRYEKYISTTKLENIDDYTIFRSMQYEVDAIKYNDEYLNWFGTTYEDITGGDTETYICVCALGDEQYRKYIQSLELNYEDIKDKVIVMDITSVARTNYDTDKVEYKDMRMYGYQIGDVITDKESNHSLQVGYVTDVKPFGFQYEDEQLFIVSDEMYDSMLSGEVPDGADIYYKTSDSKKLQEDIEEILKTESHYFIHNIDESVKNGKNMVMLIAIFLYGFIIVVTLIGITNIFNTITTNMELRKPEFAMLRSVGMTTKEFNRMIRLETVFMGVKALAFGVPIGLVLSFLIYCAQENDQQAPYQPPIISIIIAVVVVFLLISAIMKYSMGRISKQNTIETIRNENI